MKLAITGCNGAVGRRVVQLALTRGHEIIGIDAVANEHGLPNGVIFHQVDLRDYDAALKALKGCQAVIHLAAFRSPGDYAVATHNANVVISWNVLRAAAELGINRVAQASSVNVLPLVYSKTQKYDYFPLDEDHPCFPDEPYGLSKIIAEAQAAALCRRYPSMRIASIRLHWSVPNRAAAQGSSLESRKRDLWGYVQEDSGADAFLLAVEDDKASWTGHEAFFVAAPRIAVDVNTMVFKDKHFPDVPMKDGKDLSGSRSFFDCSKAEALLGWRHKDAEGD